MATNYHYTTCEALTMLPLQLVLHPDRAGSAWPSPPRRHVIIKRRNSGFSSTRRTSNSRCRTPLVLCSVQQLHRSPPTPKTLRRNRSRHLAVYQGWWMTMNSLSLSNLHEFIRYCSTVVETIISTTTTIVQSVYETASTMLQSWWSGHQEDDTTTLEVVERQPNEIRAINAILEENIRLKRMLEFAMTSHVIMNEAISMLEDGAYLWMKRAEDVVDAKIHDMEQERDALALQLEELQAQLGDKDQEIERLRDGFVWATNNLNTKEDEICELHEQLEHYETILKAAKVV